MLLLLSSTCFFILQDMTAIVWKKNSDHHFDKTSVIGCVGRVWSVQIGLRYIALGIDGGNIEVSLVLVSRGTWICISLMVLGDNPVLRMWQ